MKGLAGASGERTEKASALREENFTIFIRGEKKKVEKLVEKWSEARKE